VRKTTVAAVAAPHGHTAASLPLAPKQLGGWARVRSGARSLVRQPQEARAAGRAHLSVLSHLKVVEIPLDKGLCQLERAEVNVAVSALGLQSNLNRGWDSGQAAVLTGNVRQRNLDISIVPQQHADRVLRRVA